MDPINERRILQLIVQVTSTKNSTQYFFITPKVVYLKEEIKNLFKMEKVWENWLFQLLPDIKCSNTMTVHCIYNGPNAISAADWTLEKFLDIACSEEIEDDWIKDNLNKSFDFCDNSTARFGPISVIWRGIM